MANSFLFAFEVLQLSPRGWKIVSVEAALNLLAPYFQQGTVFGARGIAIKASLDLLADELVLN